ncbi:hypothetical protein DFH27DRAFT_643308 [Peziza echinospora]|nr:hypothetical protein DFH27DRAFT_643308 [Peziza echinospora]
MTLGQRDAAAVVVAVVALLGLMMDTTLAQETDILCRYWAHSSIVINEKVYILDGWKTYREDYLKGNLAVRKSPELTQTYMGCDMLTCGVEPGVAIVDIFGGVQGPVRKGDITWGFTPKDGEFTIGSTLWGNADGLYRLHGSFINSTNYNDNDGLLGQRPPAMWRYRFGTRGWVQMTGVPPFNRAYVAAYIAVPSIGRAYALGGEIYEATDPAWAGMRDVSLVLADSLVEFDLDEQILSNHTTPGVGPVAGAVLVHVPAGRGKGFLVALGGVTATQGTWVAGSEMADRPMSRVHVYDISARAWHVQRVTGAAPAPGLWACAAVASAADGSSHQIIYHGGASFVSNQLNGETWALTLPSFAWVRLSQGSEQRYAHTCHVVKGDTLLVIGGKDKHQDQARLTNGSWPNGPARWTCSGSAFNMLNLTTLEWSTALRAEPGVYRVPAAVVKVIGGSGLGNATESIPHAGWDSRELGSAWLGPTTAITTTTSTATPTAEPPPTTSGPSKPSVSTIIAAVTGGIIAICLLALGFVLLRRRRGRVSLPQRKEPTAAEAPRQPTDPDWPEVFEGSTGNSPYALGRQEMHGSRPGVEMYGSPSGVEMYGSPAGVEMYGSPAGAEMYGSPAGAEMSASPLTADLIQMEGTALENANPHEMR